MASEGKVEPKKPLNYISLPLMSDYGTLPPQSSYFVIQMFYNYVHFILSTLAKVYVGQMFLTFLDYFVLYLQKTLECAAPKEINKDKSVFTSNLFFYVPLYLTLQVLRFYLSTFTVVIGKGAVTFEDMLTKVLNFRQYFRSVRYFCIMNYSPLELQLKESRISQSALWQTAYFFYELIFVTKPPRDELQDDNTDPLYTDISGIPTKPQSARSSPKQKTP